jgi:hypothetical protein
MIVGATSIMIFSDYQAGNCMRSWPGSVFDVANLSGKALFHAARTKKGRQQIIAAPQCLRENVCIHAMGL